MSSDGTNNKGKNTMHPWLKPLMPTSEEYYNDEHDYDGYNYEPEYGFDDDYDSPPDWVKDQMDEELPF